MTLAATSLTVVPQTVRAQGSGAFEVPGAVKVDVDHTAKTITFTARMAFYLRNCPVGASCVVDPAVVQSIVAAIQGAWNGYKHKCYDVIFKIDARTVGSQAEAGADEVDIGIDSSPVSGIHNHTAGTGDPAKYLSLDPADAVIPGHDPANPTTWAANNEFPITWAHEFGHILGLQDNYDPADNRKLRPGAVTDLMYASRYGLVSQEMIDRVVARHGIRDSDLKCVCGNPSPATTDRSRTGTVAVVARFVTAQHDSGPIAQAEGCGYLGSVTMKYTNNMSSYGFEQKIELNLNGTVTWQINPIGGTHEIPGSMVYWPVDGSITWEEHGSITVTGASCTIKGGGTYAIRDPAHYQFYSYMEVATDTATGVSHYFAVGLEPPPSDLGGTVKLTCTPSGIDFPPGPEDLAASWLLTGDSEELRAGGKQSDPDGHLRGTYTHDSSNQGTGIRTFTWDLAPF